jgi:isoleucyl-tRNA synthetase
MDNVDALRRVVELGRSARNKGNLKIRQPLAELSFTIKNDAVADFIFEQKSVVLDELNVKALKRAEVESELIQYNVKPNLPLLGQKYGKELPAIRNHLNEASGSVILAEIRSKKSYKMRLNGESISIGRDDLLIEAESVEGYTSSGDDNVTVGLITKLTDELVKEGIVRDVIRRVQSMRKNAKFAVEDRIKIYGNPKGLVGDALKSFENFFKNEVLAVELIDEENPGEYNESFQIGDQQVTFGLKRINI